MHTEKSNVHVQNSTLNNVGRDQHIQYNINVDLLQQDEFLQASLKPAIRGGFYISPCMKGTRMDVFNQIHSWLEDLEAPNVLWLSGSPGAGKSAIASSLVEQLRGDGRLGSSFCFNRNDAGLNDPAAFWRTVAYDLARFDSTFATTLIGVLKERRVDPDRPEIDLHFRLMIEQPLRKHCAQLTQHRVPIIIVDALDECGSDFRSAQQRAILLDTLSRWAQLPKNLKLIITSRDDRMSESLRSMCTLIVLPTGDLVDDGANNDIRRFFEERFSSITGSASSNWPGEEVINRLTTRAAGLFIWAKTVMEFLEQDLPDEQLRLVLERNFGGGDDVSRLYQQILELSFKNSKRRTLDVVMTVLATIVLSKVPLYLHDLQHFVLESQSSINFILHKLSSVISIGSTDQHLRISHLSFAEFLCDQERCPHQFFVHRGMESERLTLACFRLMGRGLKFNICGLESSHSRNDDVKDLADRIQNNIPAHLSYSCRFWAAHLRDVVGNEEDRVMLLKNIAYFLHNHLLYWLEVLSLTKGVGVASVALHTAARWIGSSDMQVSSFALDAGRFVVNFHIPISESAPHIYLSALPFSPRESLVLKTYLPRFSKTLSVVNGRAEHWPALVNILIGHLDRVCSVAFSHDGRRIVSGSVDGTIRVWDAETGEIITGPFRGPMNWVHSVEFSPDGNRVVSGSIDHTIRVWDAETGEILKGSFQGHTGSVTCVGFSPDGKRIVSGSTDRTVQVWDAQTCDVIAEPFQGHMSVVNSAEFSPDGKRIVSGSSDKTIRVWAAETGQIQTGPFQGHTGGVYSVGFSPDGKCIVSGSSDNTIRVWDAQAGGIVAGPFQGHTHCVFSVRFSPCGKRIVSGSGDKTIRVWDAKTGETVAGPFQGHTNRVYSVKFSPDGKRIVSGSNDRTIRVWDSGIREDVARPFQGHTNWNNSTGFSSDDKRIVFGSEETHRILRSEIGEIVSIPFHGHLDWVTSVGFSPDGKYVVSGSDDQTIRVWDAETGRIVAGPFRGHTNYVNSVAFSPNGKHVVSGSADTTIRVWDAETGEPVAGPFQGHTNRIYSVKFSPDGKSIVSGSSDKTVLVWDAEKSEIIGKPFLGHTNCIYSVGFSPDGKRIVSGSSDMTIRVWDIETGETVAGPFQGHTNPVNSVEFSPDGKRIVSGSNDMTIRVWNAETGEIVAGPFQGHEDAVNCVGFSPDGKLIVSGSDDETIRVWDAETGQIIAAPFENHTDYVYSVAFSPDGRRIVSGSGDRTIQVWDVKTGEIVAKPFQGRPNYDTPGSVTSSRRNMLKVFDSFSSSWQLGICHDHKSNGWVSYSTPQQGFQRLFWVPPPNREDLCSMEAVPRCLPGKHVTQLDLSRFVHGSAWIYCHDPDELKI